MIPHCQPFVAPHQRQYVNDAMRMGELMRGCYIDRLESMLRELCGGYAVAVSSGTAGLILAYEYFTAINETTIDLTMPALTYIAPAQAMMLRGHAPVFVDIDPKTWGAATAVSVQVHLYGAVSPGRAPIEDACEALGIWRLSGLFGVLSFNQNKIATGGGGGALMCRSKADADAIRHAIRGGRVPGAPHIWDVIGWPFEMSNIQAAIVCAQLEVLSKTIRRKQEIAATYRKALPDIHWHHSVTYWQPCGLLDRPAGPVVTACQAHGVDVRHVWPCLADLPLFAHCQRYGALSVARNVAQYGISLPSSVDLTERQQTTVITTMQQALQECA